MFPFLLLPLSLSLFASYLSPYLVRFLMTTSFYLSPPLLNCRSSPSLPVLLVFSTSVFVFLFFYRPFTLLSPFFPCFAFSFQVKPVDKRVFPINTLFPMLYIGGLYVSLLFQSFFLLHFFRLCRTQHSFDSTQFLQPTYVQLHTTHNTHLYQLALSIYPCRSHNQLLNARHEHQRCLWAGK